MSTTKEIIAFKTPAREAAANARRSPQGLRPEIRHIIDALVEDTIAREDRQQIRDRGSAPRKAG